MRKKTEFRMDASKSTKLLTVLALFILTAFGVYCVMSGVRETVIFLVLALAVFLLYLMMPVSLTLEDCVVIVKRVAGKTTLNVSEVEEVRILEELGRGLLFGSAGLFGWYGVFVVEGETALVYSRKEKNLVLVKVRGRNYVFGIDDRQAFISGLETCGSQKAKSPEL